MKTANEAAIKNIYDLNVEILAILDTTEDGLPNHVLIRRRDEGEQCKGTYTGKVYRVQALAIGVTKAGTTLAGEREGDWLIGFGIERRWLLTIAQHCLVEAVRGWLRRGIMERRKGNE